MSRLRNGLWLPIVTSCLVAACGGDDLVLPSPGGTVAIRVVEGDGQSGAVGELLTAPVVVEVTDLKGDPVEGVNVVFALTSAGRGAEISPSTARTGSDGRVAAHVLLGDKVGLQTGEASVAINGDSAPRATFSALATAPSSPPPPPPSSDNKRPKADFDVDCRDLICSFDDKSSDDDGSIVTRQWDFGDGSMSSEQNPSHSYATGAKYDVLLTVTDDDGAADTRSHQAEPKSPPEEPPPPPEPPPVQNQPPRADFHVHCEASACAFEDTSRDDDGTVVSWSWSFGDGGTSSERNPAHVYPSDGHFEASLAVTDDDGASATQTHRIHVKKH
jgi:chitodextrinase